LIIKIILLTVSDLVSVPDYEKFASTISAALGSDASVRQLALFYQLSRDVMAAVTGDTSKNVSGWIKTYFREKIAPWVVRNRGLVSSEYNSAH
jgi:hypothetical protein